jgi:hypothetical protein
MLYVRCTTFDARCTMHDVRLTTAHQRPPSSFRIPHSSFRPSPPAPAVITLSAVPSPWVRRTHLIRSCLVVSACPLSPVPCSLPLGRWPASRTVRLGCPVAWVPLPAVHRQRIGVQKPGQRWAMGRPPSAPVASPHSGQRGSLRPRRMWLQRRQWVSPSATAEPLSQRVSSPYVPRAAIKVGAPISTPKASMTVACTPIHGHTF